MIIVIIKPDWRLARSARTLTSVWRRTVVALTFVQTLPGPGREVIMMQKKDQYIVISKPNLVRQTL